MKLMTRRSVGAVGLRSVVVAMIWAGSAAADDGARDVAHYSPDRPVDFLHMRLELDLTGDAIARKTCGGRVEYRLRPRAGGVRTLRLAAVDMEILGVELGAAAARYSYDDRELRIELPDEMAADETLDVAVRYRLEDPPAGLHFVLPNDSTPDFPTLVYTFSEPLRTRYWLPSHDWPNERWTSELRVRVPQGYSVVAHGELVGEQRSADGTLFHWRSDVPLDPHMMGFVVGEFVELDGSWRGRPLTVYAQPGTEAAARFSFHRVGEMLELFTRTLGVDFPFAGYRHVTVAGHEHGGMEQAGFSIVDPFFLTAGRDGEMSFEFLEQNLVSHMAAHQWFAGIANYRSLAHTWLNEGFASLLHTLWMSHDEPPGSLALRMWEIARRIAETDTAESGEPMVLRNLAGDPGRIFSFDGGKVYWKGAWVLNMLRHQLGDAVFWRGVAAFLEDHRWQGVESADLRRSLERASGRDLVQFFRQWVERPGIPRLSVAAAWDGATDTMTVSVRQTQKADAETPAFAFPLELYFRVDGQDRYLRAEVDGARHELSYAFESEPTQVCVDPHGGLLKTLELDVPRALLAEQALAGPTPLCRLQAVEALADDDRPASVETLTRVLRDDRQHPWVRAGAASALGTAQTEAAREALLAAVGAGIDADRALAAAVTALGRYVTSAPAHDAVLRHADPGAPLRVETAAVSALGTMRLDPERMRAGLDVLRRAARPPTRRWVRRSALRSLAALDEPAAYDTLLELARPARGDRLRAEAIRTLGSLGRHDELRDPTRRQLTAWLDDPDPAAQRAAAAALGRLGDPRSLADLQRVSASARPAALRQAAQRAIESIRNPQGPEAATSGLLQRLEALERQNQALEEQLRELREALESENRP